MLQQRVTKMESLIQKLRPGADINEELELADDFDGPLAAVASSCIRRSPPTMNDLANLNRELGDDELAHVELTRNMQNLAIDCDQDRFFGQSSGFMFARKALDVKKEYTQEEDSPLARTEVWRMHPWELARAQEPPPRYEFPEHDLLDDLVVLYFDQINAFLPVLHRPTFNRLLGEDFHRHNHHFGAVVLLVCAVASRYSDDPRTTLEGTNSKHSAGWAWYNQVDFVRKDFTRTSTLYELQAYCIGTYYTLGTSSPQAVWSLIGMGIRLAQEKGVHRRKPSGHHWTVEDELWKRSFWVLLCLDRMICSFLGRPCSVHDEDYDLELPVECDDEYWDLSDPQTAWKQPPGSPSYVAYFNILIKLYDILGFTLRTIYSVNKFKASLGESSNQWESEVVAKLDSALNQWVDLVPDHLRWDPSRQDNTFFYQSSTLYIAYYYVQIQIHRPFIPSFGSPSSLSFPSLAICANAARSCSHVIYIQESRGFLAIPQTKMAVFCAGIVLLMNIWGGRKSGLSTDPAKEMADAHKCMKYLRWCGQRWHIAGRFLDMLCHLASAGDLPLPQTQSSPVYKRDRASLDEPDSPASGAASAPEEMVRPISGSSRIREQTLRSHPASTSNLRHSNGMPQYQDQPPRPSQAMPREPQQRSPSQLQTGPYAGTSHLPIYSDQLGSLPVHGSIDFTQYPAPSQYPGASYPAQWSDVASSPDSSSQPSPLQAHQLHNAETYPASHQYDEYSYPNVVATFSGPTGHHHNSYPRGIPSTAGGSREGEVTAGSVPISHQRHNGSLGSAGMLPSHNDGRPATSHGIPPQQPSHYHHQLQFQHATYGLPSGGVSASSGPEAVGIWSNAPVNFSLEDWGTFIDSTGRRQSTMQGSTY